MLGNILHSFHPYKNIQLKGTNSFLRFWLEFQCFFLSCLHFYSVHAVSTQYNKFMEFDKERSRRQHMLLKRNQKSKEISAHNYLTCLININQGFFYQGNLSSQHFPWYFLNDIILLQLFRCKKYESKYADIFINKNALLYNFQTFCSSLNCFVFL